MNRWEADAVARSTVLPPDAPASAVTVLTEAARGGLLWVGIAAALAARPGHARCAARDGVVAVAVASASSHLIGRWLPRRRPAADHLPAYQALVHRPTSSAFPSAHAATAAAFTTAIACENPITGLVVAPVAVAVAYSRLRTRAHWPSDVVAGALWGIAVGVATRRLLRLLADADSITLPVCRGISTATTRRRLGAVLRPVWRGVAGEDADEDRRVL
jgi:membrane-associated phospholipid phosphatase